MIRERAPARPAKLLNALSLLIRQNSKRMVNVRTLLLLALIGTTVPLGAQLAPDASAGIFAQMRPAMSYLGVRIVDVDAERAKRANLSEEKGVQVAAVEDDSPAAVAGIKPGDILISYDGENILGIQQFIRLVGETPQRRKVKIQVWREGKIQTVVATTGAPPARDYGFSGNRVDFPDMRALAFADVPDPVVVWHNQMLGMECEPLSAQLAQYFGVKGGVLVRSVQPGSPAESAGLRAGDVISAIAGQRLMNPQDVGSCLRSHATGDVIPLSVTRDRKTITLNVKPGAIREPSR